jgi:hypothetical protein
MQLKKRVSKRRVVKWGKKVAAMEEPENANVASLNFLVRDQNFNFEKWGDFIRQNLV